MGTEERLDYEQRVSTRQAIIAVAAGVLLVAAAAIQLAGPHTSVDELTIDLITANQRFPLDLIASIVNAIASLGMAATLVYLMRCVTARSPEAKGWVSWVAVAGGVMAAVVGVAYAILVAVKVHTFATTGAQTYQEAHALMSTPLLIVLQVLGELGALLLAVSFVLISLSAMRVGLLTKFLGYLGMLAGALILFQIVQIPIVQGYWLAAVAYLLSGRWPTGVPPAWTTGRAVPWPSTAEMRTRAAAQRQGRGGTPAPVPAAQPAAAGGATAGPGRTRAQTPKRKRKRRN